MIFIKEEQQIIQKTLNVILAKMKYYIFKYINIIEQSHKLRSLLCEVLFRNQPYISTQSKNNCLKNLI